VIHTDVLQTAGHTPVVRLNKLTAPGSEVLVKLEGFNPGRSIKDRAAFFMIQEAERRLLLTTGGTIIESTSGNLGKSLALIGAVKGYPVILVVDPKTPRTVIQYARALNAQIDFVDTPDPEGGYQRARIARVRELVDTIPGAYWPDQYNNPDNPRAHAEQTAHELLDDVCRFDALVAAVSTGGHLSGLARTLKRHLPDLSSIGVDAVGSAAFGFCFSGYRMRGLGLAWHPGNLADELVDSAHMVEDYEGIATARALARHEGILVGESSGAAVFAAVHYSFAHPGSRCVVIAADDGANYLDETFNDGWLAGSGIASQITDRGIDTLEGLLAHVRRPDHLPTRLPSSCELTA
jgi:cysteine synthase